jgi:hypothetical protein
MKRKRKDCLESRIEFISVPSFPVKLNRMTALRLCAQLFFSSPVFSMRENSIG